MAAVAAVAALTAADNNCADVGVVPLAYSGRDFPLALAGQEKHVLHIGGDPGRAVVGHDLAVGLGNAGSEPLHVSDEAGGLHAVGVAETVKLAGLFVPDGD